MKKYLKPLNILFFSLFSITYILFFIILFSTIKYASFAPTLFYTSIFIVLFILLALSLSFYEGLIERSKKLRMTAMIGISVLFLLFSFSTYVFTRINSSVDNVIVPTTQNTSLDVSFVVYKNSSIKTEADIDNISLGVLQNTADYDNNFFVKDEIERLSLNVQYQEYQSYNDMLIDLFTGKVDVIAIPSDYKEQFETNEGYSEYLDDTTVVYSYEAILKVEGTESSIDVSKDPFTLLIMGNDGGRTDSLILATFNPLKLSVTMTSIPRDSYVPIACYPNQASDKIGHAFTVSRDCAIDTVENLMDVEINYYVVVNFTGVVEIVDALDKIWIVSPLQFVGQNSDDERGHYTVWIPKGGFWADGEQALAFSRERKLMPGGDYQRQENQQQVITSIIDRTLQLNDINKALNVLDAAGDNIKTNIPLNDMISIFNLLTKAVNKTAISPAYILEIVGSQLMGYGSFTYDETLQLPLWIAKPYQGSIEDLKELINDNLEKNVTLPVKLEPYYNAIAFYSGMDYFSLTYNEKEVHEKLPDFMPTMSYNDWTLEEVRVWASERGIGLTVDEVRFGEADYSSNYVHNYVVGQSVRYGIKTSSISSLTIDVIKHELDCKLEANQVYDECKYRLPDFVVEKTKLVDVEKWAKSLNVKLKYVIIPETDVTYDKTKIGYVIKQSPETAKDVRTLTEVVLTIMDPNYSITIPSTTTWTKTIAEEWVKTNLASSENITFTYTPTLDQTKVGLVVSTTPAANSSIKYNQILSVSVYALGSKMADYVGLLKTDMESSSCGTKFLCTFTNVITTDTTKVGKIASQSIPVDTLKLVTDWPTTNVSFGVYVLDTSTSTSPATPSN